MWTVFLDVGSKPEKTMSKYKNNGLPNIYKVQWHRSFNSGFTSQLRKTIKHAWNYAHNILLYESKPNNEDHLALYWCVANVQVSQPSESTRYFTALYRSNTMRTRLQLDVAWAGIVGMGTFGAEQPLFVHSSLESERFQVEIFRSN